MVREVLIIIRLFHFYNYNFQDIVWTLFRNTLSTVSLFFFKDLFILFYF